MGIMYFMTMTYSTSCDHLTNLYIRDIFTMHIKEKTLLAIRAMADIQSLSKLSLKRSNEIVRS